MLLVAILFCTLRCSIIADAAVVRSVHTAHREVGLCHDSATSLKSACATHAMLTSLLPRTSTLFFSGFLFKFYLLLRRLFMLSQQRTAARTPWAVVSCRPHLWGQGVTGVQWLDEAMYVWLVLVSVSTLGLEQHWKACFTVAQNSQ